MCVYFRKTFAIVAKGVKISFNDNQTSGVLHTRQMCRSMIEVKPSFQMFSEEEVLENLVIIQVNSQN